MDVFINFSLFGAWDDGAFGEQKSSDLGRIIFAYLIKLDIVNNWFLGTFHEKFIVLIGSINF